MTLALALLALAASEQRPATDERIEWAHRQLEAISEAPARQAAEQHAAEARRVALQAQFWSEIHALRMRFDEMDTRHTVDAKFWPALKEHADTIKRLRRLRDAR